MQKIKEVLSGGDSHSNTAAHGSSTGTTRNPSATATSDVGYTEADRKQGTSLGSLTGHNDRLARDTTSNTQSNAGISDNLRDTHISGTGSESTQRHSFGRDHRDGHDHSIASKFDPSAATTTHDHKHLGHVTHRDVHHTEVEEVERQREVERHVHHVQHHVQPVLDKQVAEEVHHNKVHPVTKIEERHGATEQDMTNYAALGSKHRDEETHRPTQRTIIDKGETVRENVHHHVHHVTQPVVKQEVHDQHRIHTVIPVHHTTHEAPIVHKSSLHEPVSMADFTKGGGKLNSGISHNEANVLQQGDCERTVDGPGERLAESLGLGGHLSGSTGTTTSASPTTTR